MTTIGLFEIKCKYCGSEKVVIKDVSNGHEEYKKIKCQDCGAEVEI